MDHTITKVDANERATINVVLIGLTMEAYDIMAPREHHPALAEVLSYYDCKSYLQAHDQSTIIRRKKDGKQNVYMTLEAFILGEFFYKQKRNLHHFPVANPKDQVMNFDLNPNHILRSNPITRPLFDHPIFGTLLAQIEDYGTFVRFSENKVQRLYWNLPLNAGLPLTAKEKDPVYEMVFLLHDLGHFLLPDLIFTGQDQDAKAKNLYVDWRLLGEAITVVLSEMLAVDYLKDNPEFTKALTLGYDRPYNLYKAMNKPPLRDLFWASYLFFCRHDTSGFLRLIDPQDPAWLAFYERYFPVSNRGRAWTETNFDNLATQAKAYQQWWPAIKEFKEELQWVTIDEHYSKVASEDHAEIMVYLFNHVWDHLLEPLLYATQVPKAMDRDPKWRSLRAFKRYMAGNLLLLAQAGQEAIMLDLIKQLRTMTWEDQPKLLLAYRTQVHERYQSGYLTINEYHNYKNIYYAIPPNILSKLSIISAIKYRRWSPG